MTSALIACHQVAGVKLPQLALESLCALGRQVWRKHLVELAPGKIATFSSLFQQAPGPLAISAWVMSVSG